MGQCRRVAFVHEKEFKVLPWPPNSPDLNPTEHQWDVLDQQILSMEAPTQKLAGSAANILIPDIIGHIQRSCGAHASMHQSCFGSKSFMGHLIYEISSI